MNDVIIPQCPKLVPRPMELLKPRQFVLSKAAKPIPVPRNSWPVGQHVGFKAGTVQNWKIRRVQILVCAGVGIADRLGPSGKVGGPVPSRIAVEAKGFGQIGFNRIIHGLFRSRELVGSCNGLVWGGIDFKSR